MMATLKTKNLVKLVGFSSYGSQLDEIIYQSELLSLCACVFIIFFELLSCSLDPGSSKFGENSTDEKKTTFS